eukprot:scpid91948/ scgid21925/ 
MIHVYSCVFEVPLLHSSSSAARSQQHYYLSIFHPPPYTYYTSDIRVKTQRTNTGFDFIDFVFLNRHVKLAPVFYLLSSFSCILQQAFWYSAASPLHLCFQWPVRFSCM